MAFHSGIRLLFIVWLCSLCTAQDLLQSGEMRQVKYQVEDGDPNEDLKVIQKDSLPEEDTTRNIPLESGIEKSFTKKTTYCLGCAMDVPIDQPGVMEMAEEALATMDQLVTSGNIHARPRILGVKKQVVNGIQYYIQMEVSLSSCLKSENPSRSTCEPMPDIEPIICEVTFLHQPWSSSKPYLMANNCTNPNSDNSIESYTPDDLLAVERSSGMENTLPPLFQVEVAETTTQDRQDTTTVDMPVEAISEERRGRNVGMTKTMDVGELSLIKELADTAIHTLNEVDPTDSHKEVIDVIDAKKQIVDGLLYRLLIRVGTKLCSPTDQSSNSEESSSSSSEDGSSSSTEESKDKKSQCSWTSESICSVQLHRSWAGDTPYKAKVVKSECEESWELGSRDSRDLQEEESYIPIDPRPEIEGWDECVKKFLGKLDDFFVHSKMNAERMLGRVSNDGKKLELMAVGEIDSRRWIIPRDVRKVYLGLRPKMTCNLEAKKRLQRDQESVLVGGLSDADKNDSQVKEAVEFALAELDARSNDPNKLQVVEVLEAKKQVVSGVLYHLKLGLAPSNCRKGDASATNCAPTSATASQTCSVKVWVQSWLNRKEVTDVDCTPTPARFRRSPSLPGGLSDADKNDAEVKKAVEFALAELDARSNDPNKLQVVEVLEAKKQVVSGMLYHLKLALVPSNCKKGETSATSCTPTSATASQTCSVKVWVQPWLNRREVTDVDCTPTPARFRRSLESFLGPAQRISEEDPEVKDAISYALPALSNSTNSMYQQEIVRVLEAKVQLVAGKMYNIKLVTASSNRLKNSHRNVSGNIPPPTEGNHVCTVKVLYQAWLNKRTILHIRCEPATSESQARPSTEADQLVNVGYTSDPYVREIADFTRKKIDEMSNAIYIHKIVKVLEAKKQEAAGITTNVKLEVILTTCTKNGGERSSCDAQPDRESEQCTAEVWDRPWLKSKKIRHLKCGTNTLISTEDFAHAESIFAEFVLRYNKSYENELQWRRRFNIFKQNLNLIKELQDNEQGTATYGPTIFADLTREEFQKRYLGLRPDLRQDNAVPMPHAVIPNIKLPTSFDWRDQKVVTPVKNQGLCGSCWAFAVTGDIEGQYAIKNKKLISFSEQELVDCDTLDDGCQGGLPDNAYRALEQLGGLESEQDYPYDGRGETCSFNKTLTKVKVRGGLNISSDETDIAKWLVQNGPIAIGINANAMQFYFGGVSHPLKFLCSPSSLDHGVLIVGFGEHRTTLRKKLLPYWLIKNSWGTFWGEKGYYRIYRGDGSCGVNMMASSAIIE